MSVATEGIREIEVPAGVIKYDSDMPMGVLKALMKSGADGDLGAMQESLALLVVEWCYEGDPKDVESWDLLRRSEFQSLTEKMMEDLGSLGEE